MVTTRQIVLSLLLLTALSNDTRSQTPERFSDEASAKEFLGTLLEQSQQSPEYGKALLSGRSSSIPFKELSADANQLIAEFRDTFSEPDEQKRRTRQRELLKRLDWIRVRAYEPTSTTSPQPRADAVAQDSGDLSFSPRELFGGELERKPGYSMPLELSTAEAGDLIEKTALAGDMLGNFPGKLRDYSGQVAEVVNSEVRDRLWHRLVSKQGFKDATIGNDWYEIAAEHTSLVSVIEDLVGTGTEMVGIVLAQNRLEGVRMRLIGGRVTMGDRVFVRGVIAWLSSREAEMSTYLTKITALQKRLKTEGIIGK